MSDIEGKLLVSAQGHRVVLNFERYHMSDTIEKIRVYGKQRDILLQSNRPAQRGGRMKKAVTWKVISPPSPDLYKFQAFLMEIFSQLEYTLDDIEYPKSRGINVKSW